MRTIVLKDKWITQFERNASIGSRAWRFCKERLIIFGVTRGCYVKQMFLDAALQVWCASNCALLILIMRIQWLKVHARAFRLLIEWTGKNTSQKSTRWFYTRQVVCCMWNYEWRSTFWHARKFADVWKIEMKNLSLRICNQIKSVIMYQIDKKIHCFLPIRFFKRWINESMNHKFFINLKSYFPFHVNKMCRGKYIS